ncbi:CSMD3 [Branchiostoma lanceolatum]|uniref:CSMD3 protein n=1 Tax=Branchiostoma lanceolatum TaxID=7740 RepID=A0A8J9ZKZ5_BRALA|nr:CSMD3 [Branchiostoma lanceolatum]
MGVLTVILLPVLLIVVAAQNEIQPAEEAGAADPVPRDWELTGYLYKGCSYRVEFERKDVGSEKCQEDEPSVPHIHDKIKDLLEEEKPKKKGCPISDYVNFNGVCYKDFDEPKTYSDARQRCAEDGGLVAMPKDNATNAFISDLRIRDGYRWIGLTDANSEGQWVFEDGQSWQSSGYSNWRPGEPNNIHQGEDCVVFGLHAMWNDLGCDAHAGFICQLEQVESASLKPHPEMDPEQLYEVLLQQQDQIQEQENIIVTLQDRINSGISEEPPSSSEVIPSVHRCPDNYSEAFNGKCYRFSRDKETFSSAQDICGHDGGQLATIKGLETNEFIVRKLRDDPAMDRVWIGLDDRKEEEEFVWSDGTNLASTGYTNWFHNQPDNWRGSDEDCVEMRSPSHPTHKWNDLNCHAKLRFVCEKGTIEKRNVWGRQYYCTAGYMQLDKRCYKLSTEHENFRSAQTICGKEGGRLATIPNKNTNDFLLQKIRAVHGYEGGYWIGLNDMENEGTFVWSDGSTLSQATAFADWNPGQPDNHQSDGEDCVHMDKRKEYMWNDMSCGDKAHFVCEKEEMVDQHEPTVSQLEQELQEKDETIQQMSQQQQHREEELQDLTELNQQLQQQLEQKEEEIQVQSGTIDQCNINLQGLETVLAHREKELHNVTDRNQHLLQQLHQKEEELQNKTEIIRQQSHQLQELQPVVEQLQHKERELEETLMELERAQAYLVTNEQLSQQLHQKEEDLLNKTEVIQDLTEQLVGLLQEPEPMSGDSDLQADLQAKDEIILEQAQLIADLQQQWGEQGELIRLMQMFGLQDQPRTTVQTTTELTQGACGGTFETAPGAIGSPGYPGEYPDNADCIYIIAAPPGQSIIIDFQQFDLEQNFDKLILSEDGVRPHREEFTGQKSAWSYRSDTNQVQMHFTSDGGVTDGGFSLRYRFFSPEGTTVAATATATCEGLDVDTSTITSPDYPMQYPDNVDCTYTIQAPPGHIVRIIFEDFLLEADYDFLDVTDPQGGTKRYTGSIPEETYTSQTNEVQLHFTTDGSMSDRGFKVTYEGYVVSSSSVTTATATCEGLDEHSSIIISPGFPTSYPDDIKCNYTIKAPPGHIIQIIFEAFDLEPGYDFLNISDFPSGTNNKRYTGDNAAEVYTSRTNEVQLNFTSDFSQSHSGFKLTYRSVNGNSARDETRTVTSTTPSSFISNIICDNLDEYATLVSFDLGMLRHLYNCTQQPSESGSPPRESTTPDMNTVPSACSPGYVSHRQKCYWVSDMEEDYSGAEELCSGLGGKLAVIKDADTQEFLADYIRSSRDPSSLFTGYWIGLQNHGTVGNFVWSDGSPLLGTGYHSWRSEPISRLGNEGCVYIWPHDGFNWWTDHSCTMDENFICEIDSVQEWTSAAPPTTTVTNICEDLVMLARRNVLPRSVLSEMLEYCPQLQSEAVATTHRTTTPGRDMNTEPPCPEGFFSHGQKCYWVSDDGREVNYGGAEELCNSFGGKLAVIKDADTQEFLDDYIRENRDCCDWYQNGYWIGLKDHDDNGNYIWSDGSTLSGYNNWQPGEPSNHLWSENCVHMYARFNLKWNDQRCSIRMGCICEIAKTGKETTPSLTTVSSTPTAESKCEDLVAYANQSPTLQSPAVIRSILEDCLQLQSEVETTMMCPEHYSLYHEACYRASTNSAPYQRAEETCAEDTASLVVIKDHGTQRFLENVTNHQEYWIGLSDRNSEEFMWSDGSPITDFASWRADEPSRYTTGWWGWRMEENCVSMSPLWNDRTCDGELPYICQKAPDIHVTKKASKPDLDTLLSIIQQQEDRLVDQQETMQGLEVTINHTEQELDTAQNDLVKQNQLVQQLVANISTQREDFLDVIADGDMEKEEIAAQCSNTIANLTTILELLSLPDTSTAQPQNPTTQQPQPTGSPTEETAIQLACSPGYLEFETKCYTLGKEERRYGNAQSQCQTDGGKLLTWKESHGSLEKLVEALWTPKNGQRLYIQPIYNVWVDSTVLREHTGFRRGCWLHRIENSKNFQEDCKKRKAFICEKELEAVQSQTTESIPTVQVTKRQTTTPQTTERISVVQTTDKPPTPQPTEKVTTEMAEQQGCTEGYLLFQGTCYKPYINPLSNQEAKHVCQTDGGYLLPASDDPDWMETMNLAKQQFPELHHLQDMWVDNIDTNGDSPHNPAGSYMQDACWLRFIYKPYSEPWACGSLHYFICAKDLPSPECPAHSSWSDCGSACPATCDTLGTRSIICPEVCIPSCKCDDGYVKEGSDCIPEDQCRNNGCYHNGNHYDVGAKWADESPGLNCECAIPKVMCLVLDCAPDYQHVIGADGTWTCQEIKPVATSDTVTPSTNAAKVEPVTEIASVLQCPTGYELFRDNCYKVFDIEMDYRESEALCEEDGAMLAMPRDQSTDDFLIKLRSSVNPQVRYWIGLTDREKEGAWVWADRRPLGAFSSWAAGEPNSAGEEDCVVYAAHPSVRDKWNDVPCNHPYRFICQKPAMGVPVVVADKSTNETPEDELLSPTACPPSYSEFKGKCYSLFTVLATQVIAAHICGEQGGQLVVHDEDPEWLAFFEEEMDAVHGDVTTFQYWKDEPEDLSGFAMIRFKVQFGDLTDACWARNPVQRTTLPTDCFTKLNFICEQDMSMDTGADQEDLSSNEGATTTVTTNKVTVKPMEPEAEPTLPDNMEEPKLDTGDSAFADLLGKIQDESKAEDPALSDHKQEAELETGDPAMKELLSKLKYAG